MTKFRSWDEKRQRFYYFVDGKYFDTIKCEFGVDINKSLIGDNMLFNWQNAEQEFTRCKVTFFEGDKFSINGSVYGVIAVENGILGFKRYETCCNEYRGFSKISEYPIRIMNKIGNIYEPKEIS